MMKNRHPLASYLVPTTHLGDETRYTQNGSHAQSFREQLSASFNSLQFDVIFFGISETVILVGARPHVFWRFFLAFFWLSADFVKVSAPDLRHQP
jgi:hypothetical protein